MRHISVVVNFFNVAYFFREMLDPGLTESGNNVWNEYDLRSRSRESRLHREDALLSTSFVELGQEWVTT